MWGGRRKNAGSGGKRPRSGPLRRSFSVSPFSSHEKGDTESEATIVITRCNLCGAWGWNFAPGEPVYDQSAMGADEKPLEHLSECKYRKEEK